mmetsp:Transcript_4390/g.7720  ORF Transcript_4390/g.7720 Transcript_4390/m.7720 type:complete len:232 (-) Transcript_4390:275-970(-)
MVGIQAKVAVVCVLAAAQESVAFPQFRDGIPNGDILVFGGQQLGHIDNPPSNFDQFGARVAPGGANLNWLAICDEDFDNDGLTNGEEMGDPECVFTPGDTPARVINLTNPLDPENLQIINEGGVDDEAGFEVDPLILASAGVALGFVALAVSIKSRNARTARLAAELAPVVNLQLRSKPTKLSSSTVVSKAPYATGSNPASRVGSRGSDVSEKSKSPISRTKMIDLDDIDV